VVDRFGDRPGQPSAEAWLDRFEIRRKLAAGTFGVVYLAYDHQRGIEVAIKTLREATGAELYRFKREFRGLADIVHPNLVTLHELHQVGEQWFFTMEYVPGGSFLDWVRPKRDAGIPGAATPSAPLPTPDLPSDSNQTTTMRLPVTPPTASERPELRLDRLEDTLFQLVDGVYALHVTHRLHRDLKPSNVSVTPDGRVVLLDFGLTSDLRGLSADHTHEASVVGTPIYMSPEQAEDLPLGPASDWYSVGVMLFEALTGRRPFEGPPMVVLQRKRSEEAPRARDLAPDVPAELDSLCSQLLSRDPARRPDGKAIFAALGRAPSAATLQLASSAAPRFVGRRAELEFLGHALDDTRDGRPVAVLVRGSSGMGKSALVRQFVDDIAIPAGAIVLEGRCYERESVPYKGLDSVIDALATYLVQQPADRLERLLPRDIQALARLFPVLKRVPDIAEPAKLWLAPPNPHETRRRAFVALRYLMRRIASDTPLVVYIDDVQWGDVDAATFLADLVLHPEPPAMLLVASCRLEEEESSLLIQQLRQRGPADADLVRELVLDGFSPEEADELVANVVGARGADVEIAALLRESRGNPLFLSELARARSASERSAGLDELIAQRVERLPDTARRLFEVCAVAGRPMPMEVAVASAELSGEGTDVTTLQRERLLRVRTREGARLVEPYHDRLRESAVARLPAERQRELHRNLAEAFEAVEDTDPEALTTHWRGAAEHGRAMRWALVAAQAAMDAYAFNHATALYREVLDSYEPSPEERHATKVRLGHSLENAGRLDEAAALFGEAAVEAEGLEQLDLRRLQVELLLRRGQLNEGRPLARDVLRSVGFRMPSTRRGALLSVIGSRMLIRLRGLGFKERSAADIPEQDLQGLDVLFSVSSGLGFLDPIPGRALQARYMRRALELGEPERVAKALCLEIAYRSQEGESAWTFCEELRARGLAIADHLGSPTLRGQLQGTSGLAAFLTGRYALALERMTEAATAIRDHSVGLRYQIGVTEIVRIGSLLYLGRIREMNRMLAILVREAEESGDLYTLRGLCTWRGNIGWLLQDQPDVARHYLATAITPRAPDDYFNLHHYYELLSHCQFDLYVGAIDAATARIGEEWRLLERSMLLRLQSVRIEGRHLRGRVALASAARHAADSVERRRDVAIAAAMAKAIEKEELSWGRPLAELLRAGVANLGGKRDVAERHLRVAMEAFSEVEMALYANVARRCLGLLTGGDAGRSLVAGAEAWMEAEGIRAPAAVCRMMAPGCPEA